jgi:hypothetical protein|tara:strand:- start:1439 stop:1918 length:480 start_codon:yes stop_codon:yes gene_type:complete
MTRATERIGRSGEYLTCSVIARETDTVTVMPHGANADIIFEYDNQMYRCQVKTVTHIEKARNSWRFDLRKGSHSKSREYKENTIDIFALVNLKYQNVYFLPFNNCKYLQYSVHDEPMKAVNSIESFREAMDAIISANGRQIGISVHDIPLEKPQKLAVI